MRRPTDCHPGTGKTDACGAYVIADAARTMPHLLHSIDPDGERAGRTDHGPGLRRRPRPGRHPHLQPAARTAHLDPSGPRTRPGTTAAPPGGPGPAPDVRLPGRSVSGQHRRAHPHHDRCCPTHADPAGAGRTDPCRLGRAHRPGPRHGLGRRDHLRSGRVSRRPPQAPRDPGDPHDGPAGGLPSREGPDLHARGRSQDRCPHPGRDRRRQRVPHRRPPGLLRGTDPHYPSFGNLHPGAKGRPAAATRCSNGPCSWPRSPR